MTVTRTPSPQSLSESSTRRSWFVVGLVMALLVVSAGALGWWFGSSDESVELPAIIQELFDARLAGDPGADTADAIAALYTEDAVREDRAIPRTETTRSDIRLMMLQGAAYVDFTDVEIHTVVTGEDVVIVESTWSGMSSNITRDPSDKEPFSTQVVTVYEIEDDLIARSIHYYDADEFWNLNGQ